MPAPAAPPAAAPGAPSVLASDLKRAWRAGADPDVVGALRDHPELLGHRSVVVDLAYEEYCLREEAGEAPDPDGFCRDLPAFRSQVREVLRGHRLVADHPELFESPEPAWPASGDGVAGLAVVQELGRGAFARVYLARDPDTGNQPVVVKLSRAGSGEAKRLGPVRHPHVVGVHWAREVGGLHALCLPFVGAATLRDVIDAAFDAGAGRGPSARTVLDAIDRAGAPLPEAPDPVPRLLDARRSYPEAVAAVAHRLAGALAHLHRVGVAHGDLKPSNILLGPGGHPYLIDFNLAAGADDSLVRCGGTVPYMAPERLRVLLGLPQAPGPADKADVYAFGVVLFEALTGRLPFEPAAGADVNAAAADLLRRQATGVPRVAGVPRSLARQVERCLGADPAGRPSAEALERAFEQYLRRRARRRRLLVPVAGAVVASLLVGQLGGRMVPPAGEPPAPDARTEPQTPDELFADGLRHLRAGKIALAMEAFDAADRARPDGRTAAYLAYCLAKRGGHAGAAGVYERARVQLGYDEAWARNNRAYSLMQQGSAEHFRLAVVEADAAVRLDPGLRAARLNRAFARFRDVRKRNPKGFPPADLTALEDIRAVLRDGPYTADLYYKSALIVVTFGGGEDEAAAEAVRYLTAAVELGQPPGSLAQDRVLKPRLKGRPDFERLVERTAGAPAPQFDHHVAAPPDL